ncbi:glycosyltransferase [Lyngbya aestuarii]|uniref:glycosyltransferase n=1 Tax=Lyngbya aestuarii TaxID=118322 RepID=UPI00403DDF5A
MKILMISSTFPFPPTRGGTEIRTFNLLKYLQQRHQVTLITQRHAGVSDAEVESLDNSVSNLVVFPLPTPPKTPAGIGGLLAKAGRFTESLVKNTPPNVLYRYSPQIQALVDDYVRARRCDVITCEHSVNEVYIRPEFRAWVPTVINIHSSLCGWVSSHLAMKASPNPLRDRLYLSLLLARYEKRYCSKFSELVVTTEDDRQQFHKLLPQATIEVIPNGVDLEMFPYRQVDPGGNSLIFVGVMDAEHNVKAVRFFAFQVLPLLQQRYPKTTFTIAGAKPIKEVLELGERPGVIVTGGIPSIAEYLHKTTVCVVPLQTGLGIKNKTLEAMAGGIPVVGSNYGLEGLVVDGANTPLRALRANQVEEYIEAISRLFDNPKLREKLSRNGRSLVEQEYTWDQVGQCYEQVLNRLQSIH